MPRFAAPLLEEATGTRLYYAEVEIFPGQISGLRRLDRDVLDWEMVEAGEVQTLQFEPPGTDRFYLAAARASSSAVRPSAHWSSRSRGPSCTTSSWR